MTDLAPDSQSSDGECPRPPDEEPEAELRSEDGYFNEHKVPGGNYGTEMETEEVAATGVGESAELTKRMKRKIAMFQTVNIQQRGTGGTWMLRWRSVQMLNIGKHCII